MVLDEANLTKYPRMTLHCGCGNEFIVNVMRFQSGQPVVCQICGDEFPKDLAEQFAKALYDMFKVKYELDRRQSGFDLSFIYKSTYKQPPAPHGFDPDDFKS